MIIPINKPLAVLYSIVLHLLCFFLSLVAFSNSSNKEIVEIQVLNHIELEEKRHDNKLHEDKVRERKLFSVKGMVVNNSNVKKKNSSQDSFVKRKEGEKLNKKILEKVKKDGRQTANQSFLKTLEETKENVGKKRGKRVEEDNFIDPMIIQRIKSRISSNWNVSVFAGAKEMAMQSVISLKLNKAKEIVSIKDKQLGEFSGYYKVFLESIIRALYDSSPFIELDLENYDTWKEFEIRFDSSGMVY